MATVLRHAVTIAAPPADVLAFAADPRTWPRWHPTTVSIQGPVDRPVAAGDRFDEVIRRGRTRGQIRWQVGTLEPARRFTVAGDVDFPLMRGTRVEVVYEVTAVAGGTRFDRELRYTPGSRSGRLLDRLYFRGHNERQSQIALEQLRTVIEARAARSVRPAERDPPGRVGSRTARARHAIRLMRRG